MTDTRILFVDHTAALGGAELYLLDAARAFGNSATVILFEDGPLRKRLHDAGIRCEVISAPDSFLSVRKESGLGTALRAIPGMAVLLRAVATRARSHDLVVANSQKSLLVAGPAARWARRPFVWILHDLLTADHFSRLNRQVAVRVTNATAARVLVNSRATMTAFAESGGDASRCRVVHNGMDPERFSVGESQTVRASLGIGDAPLIGVFSRLAHWKGQHVLIDALPALPNVHALLVGAPLFEGDTAYADRLRDRAVAVDVNERVHFLGFRDDVPQLMQTVDVVAHTSVAPEPFGRVIVEAMLTGTPVVATQEGGPTEIVRHGDTGLLVPPSDADALATAARRVLDNPEWAGSMATTARAYARDHFSVTTMQRRIRHLLQPLVRE